MSELRASVEARMTKASQVLHDYLKVTHIDTPSHLEPESSEEHLDGEVHRLLTT